MQRFRCILIKSKTVLFTTSVVKHHVLLLPTVAKKLDMIACNDVSRPDIGFASDENAMTVFFAQSYHMEKRELEKASKQEISQQLVEAIHDALLQKS